MDILHEDLRAFKIFRRLRDKNEKYARVREAKESAYVTGDNYIK